MFFYSEIGKNGRIGNQMFQYATLFALGKTRKTDIGILDSATEVYRGKHKPLSIIEAFPNLSVKKLDKIVARGQYREDGFLFSPNIFLLMDDCDIHGFFQSPYYFAHFKDEVKKEFQFRDDINKVAEEKISEIRGSKEAHICSLHFRRTDYLGHPNFHTNLGLEYYNQAIAAMTSKFPNIKFVAFSDDPEWLRTSLPSEIIPSPGENQLEDMCMMMKCDSHIIANSSFSWWGAWLSDSTQLVIAPRQWFGPEGPKEWGTIYDRQWSVI